MVIMRTFQFYIKWIPFRIWLAWHLKIIKNLKKIKESTFIVLRHRYFFVRVAELNKLIFILLNLLFLSKERETFLSAISVWQGTQSLHQSSKFFFWQNVNFQTKHWFSHVANIKQLVGVSGHRCIKHIFFVRNCKQSCFVVNLCHKNQIMQSS
jgi:hypothetical protein